MKIYTYFKTALLLIVYSTFLFICSCEKKNSFIDRQKIIVAGSDDKDMAMAVVRVICRIINHDYLNEDIYTKPLETEGSLSNIMLLCEGKVGLAIANSVSLDYASKGQGVFKNIKNVKNLRSIAGLIFEGFTIVVNDKSGINSIGDLRGKNISLPQIGSAARLIADEILKYNHIQYKDLHVYNYDFNDCIKAMDSGKIDGFMTLTAHPNPYLYGITNSKNINCKLLGLNDATIKHLQKVYHDIKRFTISKNLYKYTNSINSVETVGSRDVIITRANFPSALIYYITQDLCEDFGAFKSVNKSFAEVTTRIMASNLCIPVHKGAYKYYKKAKLAKYIPVNLRTDNSNAVSSL